MTQHADLGAPRNTLDMAMEWTPSAWGRTWTRSPDWRITLQELQLRLVLGGDTHVLDVENEGSYRISRGMVWTDISIRSGTGKEIRVDGLPNRLGDALTAAIDGALADKRLREDVAIVRREHQLLRGWLQRLADEEQAAKLAHRWFSHDMQRALEQARPGVNIQVIESHLSRPEVITFLGPEASQIQRDLADWKFDWPSYWIQYNRDHTARELVGCRDLFDRVESKPLTEEQARAVVCFDNRVQVVAAAGSGKTSTMVARAAYAIHRGLARPEQIVLLAFNKKAAEELKERAARSFDRLGMDGITVEAATFHSLGLRILGKATGEKPDVPEWAIDTGRGMRKLAELVDRLKDRSPTFRSQWDLFRFVFKQNLPALGEPEPVDTWDAQGKGGLRTAQGETVKSLEEVMIADWLFLNGVSYTYEGRYEVRTANEDYRQYRPDFHYPDIDLYHEHFALDAQGRAPVHFEGYMEGVAWKRDLHRDNGTELFETTSYGLRKHTSGDLERLGAELTARGIELDPNPDRPIPTGGQPPMQPAELMALLRTFITHAKSNCLTVPAMRERLEALPDKIFKPRHRMFLDLAEPVMDAWDAALKAEGGIDFEDMLNRAAEHLESGRYEAPFELVMADEFQDASRARARLCRALVRRPHRYLFAVGDDWQSINRFAGADVAVMTRFRDWFGHGQVLKLEQTFRCPQELCDVSSAFVSKNPAQIAKEVRSVAPAIGPALQAFQVDHTDKLTDAVDQFVVKLAEGVRDGSIPPGRNGRVTVYVLGRYNADEQHVPTRQSRFKQFVEVEFLTVHRSKGSEADYVILPEMVSAHRKRSFPSTRADDPILSLAMPDGDDFPLGEERRLFYVALTRARRGVIIFTARGRCSSFVRELEEAGAVVLTYTDGKPVIQQSCPSCKQGVLLHRTGPYGGFQSCSNYPICSYKPPKNRAAVTPPPARNSHPPAWQPLPARTTGPTAQAAPSKTTQKSALGSTLSFLQGVEKAAVSFSERMRLANVIQQATAALSQNIQGERIVLQSAMDRAVKAAEIEQEISQRGPEFRAIYEKILPQIEAASADLERNSPMERRPIPDFSQVAIHADKATQEAIEEKVAALKQDRVAFLATIHRQLSGDPSLRREFAACLKDLQMEHYWEAVDPTMILRRLAAS